MLRTILIYGLGAGLVVTGPMMAAMVLGSPDSFSHSYYFGYTVMLLAFSLTFVGVKRYRDRVGGGVIRFLPALGLGLGISLVATVMYVIGWEITLAATDYAFMNDYAASAIRKAQEGGKSTAEIAAITAQMEQYKAIYANPLMRMGMTATEIFPVGVLVSLIAAVLFRFSRFLPAKVVQAG